MYLPSYNATHCTAHTQQHNSELNFTAPGPNSCTCPRVLYRYRLVQQSGPAARSVSLLSPLRAICRFLIKRLCDLFVFCLLFINFEVHAWWWPLLAETCRMNIPSNKISQVSVLFLLCEIFIEHKFCDIKISRGTIKTQQFDRTYRQYSNLVWVVAAHRRPSS